MQSVFTRNLYFFALHKAEAKCLVTSRIDSTGGGYSSVDCMSPDFPENALSGFLTHFLYPNFVWVKMQKPS